MAHNLFLGMYTFTVKKARTSNKQVLDNNQYLSNAYSEIDESKSKFTEGFVKDIIALIDNKAYKNDKNTHGAILEDKAINSKQRTLDLLINGGITGIKQFVISEDGKKRVLSNKEIVGLKFFARVWLPANTETGYIFIQRYGSLSIKPIFDSILKEVYSTNGHTLISGRALPTTTQKRLKEFLKKSSIRDVTILSKTKTNQTGQPNSTSASIRLRNIKTIKKGTIQQDDIDAALKEHGFKIGNRKYEMKATYENTDGSVKEEKTAVLDSSEETINIIPNIIIPQWCIDNDNYPIFKKIQELVDNEMAQIKKEAKL